jgi:hypothetical protein
MTSAWMRATAPAGSADYVGKVSWSGELGYGVRAPEAGQTAEGVWPPPVAHDDHGHDAHGHDAHDEAAHGGGHS